MTHRHPTTWIQHCASALLLVLSGTALAAGTHTNTHAHAVHSNGSPHASSAGEPGLPNQAQRSITIEMDDRMRYTPDHIQVQSGDTVRFVVKNLGQLPHEFSLGTQAELRAHQQQMQAMPHMQHHNEPGKLTLSPGQQGEVVWRFGQSGTVHFACLVPGHYEAGMQGRVQVTQP